MNHADHELDALRAQLDIVDAALLRAVGERFALCARIAEHKRRHGVPMMQPARVDVVLARAEAFGAANGIDAGFMRRLYGAIVDEACRVEDRIIGSQPASVLASSVLRIDHIAVAVRELEPAIATLRDHFGFEEVERRRVHGEISGMHSATVRAGGVTFVLCEGDSPRSNVSQYIAAYGPGVQHVALEVAGQPELLEDLLARSADLLTGLLHGAGLDQSFTKRDANTGLQLEFVTRTDREGFDDDNVRELFTAMERENVF